MGNVAGSNIEKVQDKTKQVQNSGSDTEEYSSDFESYHSDCDTAGASVDAGAAAGVDADDSEWSWSDKSSYQIDVNTFWKNKLDSASLELDYVWAFSSYNENTVHGGLCPYLQQQN